MEAYPASWAPGQIDRRCSRQRRIAEVVVAVHVLAPQERFALIGERSYPQFGQRIDAGDDRQLRFRLRGTAAVQVEFIEGFYNRRRRHSALGYQSPVAFEAARTGAAA